MTPEIPPPTFNSMATFDPSEPALLHDRLNDFTFAWLPDWRDDYEQHAVKGRVRGVMEWAGRQLDGWCEPLGG